MNAALQLLARQLRKPPFDLIDPGRRCRCEVDTPMRLTREPSLDLRRLVGGIVVHHEVYVRPLGRLQRPCPLKDRGIKLAQAKGHKRARVAVARKLPVLLCTLWRTGTGFRWN